MVYEKSEQSTAWMETDCSKHTHFRWKINEDEMATGAFGRAMGEAAPLTRPSTIDEFEHVHLKISASKHQQQYHFVFLSLRIM